VLPPVKPMLAKAATKLPIGDDLYYEPKWDGFRCVVFRDGDEVELGSRNERPLTRYFPEVVAAVKANLPEKCVVDGEIVVPRGDRLHFEDLLQRIHPAESRINMLAEQTPTTFIAFDLLAHDDEVLLELPQRERRARLKDLVADPVQLTPCADTPEDAEQWLQDAEGVIAKETSAPYKPGERTGMRKIKRVRTIDAVVMGWRPGKEEGTVGSLILGLHEPDGRLRPVGHTSGFNIKQKRELPAKLAPYETGQRGHGDPSRWNNERELEWIELRPELVVEVTFDHTSNNRIRHGTRVLRWRDDKAPADCKTDQLAG
jgi:ATP-dependent DNA ligase